MHADKANTFGVSSCLCLVRGICGSLIRSGGGGDPEVTHGCRPDLTIGRYPSTWLGRSRRGNRMQSARKVRTSPRTMTRGEPEILRCCPLQSSILALGGKCEENTPEVSAVGFPERYSSVARAGQGRVQSHGNSAGNGRRADVQRPAARYQYARSGGPRKASVRLWTRPDGRNVRAGDRPR